MADLCLSLSAGEDTSRASFGAAGAGGRGEADRRAAGKAGPAEGVENNAGNIPG